MRELFVLFGLLVFCFALGAAPLAYAKEDVAAQPGAAPKAAPQVDATPQATPKADAAAQADATAQSDAVARPATPPEVNSREGFLPEFPGRYFGMSPEEVIKLEGQPDEAGSIWLAYYRKLNNIPWTLFYLIFDNQVKVLGYEYIFPDYKLGTSLPFGEFEHWERWLETKYGLPQKHYRFWGKKPDDKSLRRTDEMEAYYWETKGIVIQFVLWPPKVSNLEERNNKPYMQLLYYIED